MLYDIVMAFKEITYDSKTGFTFHHTLSTVEQIKSYGADQRHSHPQYEIYYLISGNVKYHISGQTYVIKKGDILILNAFEYHRTEILPTEDYDRYVLEFTGENVPIINGFNPLENFFKVNPFISFIPKEIVKKYKIFDYLKEVEEEAKNVNSYTNHAILSLIIGVVSRIGKAINEIENVSSLNISLGSLTDEYVNKAIAYINKNVHKKIKIEDIALSINISKSYLQHLFKNSVGIPISTYINKQKMQVAQFMIKSGKSLEEIANELGYEYYSTFSASYKKFFGVSPRNLNIK